MKLVKEIATDKYYYIDNVTYTNNSSLYIDRTDSISYWDVVGNDVVDVWTRQDNLKRLYTTIGWVNAKDFEKDILIKYGVGDVATEVIPYLMGKGMTQQEAQMFWLGSVANIISQKSEFSTKRANHQNIALIVYSFLAPVDADGLLNATFNFFMLYKEKVYLGTQYGDNSDGLMDFVENTGGYASSLTTGLNKYPILPDVITAYGTEAAARAAFRQQLADWLLTQTYNGKYYLLNEKLK